MINETIDKLKELQGILSEKFRVENEIRELPRALATKKELVTRLKRGFVEKNELYESSRKRVAELRVRLQEAEADREKYESQMDQITTAREYDALDREIRDASEREQQYRRDLAREERELEEQRARLEREEAMIKTEEQELEDERKQIDSASKNKNDELEQLSTQEQATVPGLDESLLFKFERIIRNTGGQGIVPIRSGVCTGCQMILPNQFVNDVRDAHNVLFCPYCSRIVFYLDDGDDAFDTGFSESDEEGLADLVGDDFDSDLLDDEDLIDMDDALMADPDLDDDDDDEDEGGEAHEESDDDDDDEDEAELDGEDEEDDPEDDFDEDEEEE